MKPILICPHERPAVPLLSENEPLSNAPLLGHSILEYWLSHLACSGVKETLILSSDRPEQVQALVGNGSRWGIAVEVSSEIKEMTPEQALARYGASASSPDSAATAVTLDHFPGLPEYPLFASYAQCYAALQAWMPRAQTPDRVGMRELQPGVWVGLHGHISPKAELRAPCWLGDNVFVGQGAIVGPGTVLESGAFIEADALVESSYIGPSTFVGKYVRVKESLARGDTLVDWQTDLQTKVTDAFLLCSFGPVRAKRAGATLLERLADFCAAWKEDQSVWQQALLLKRGAHAEPAPAAADQFMEMSPRARSSKDMTLTP